MDCFCLNLIIIQSNKNNHFSLISWVKWNSFWGSLVASVVKLQVNTIVVVMTFIGIMSGLDSGLGSINFSLIDINISVINPHWIRSELVSSTISPGSSWSVSDSSSLIVLINSHGSLVLLIVQGLKFQELKLLSLQWVKSKVGANANNVILLFKASVLVVIIGNEASLVGWNCSETEFGQGNSWKSKFIASASCVLDSVMEFSSRIGERVVMWGPVLVEVDCVGVGLDNYSYQYIWEIPSCAMSGSDG